MLSGSALSDGDIWPPGYSLLRANMTIL